MNLPNIRCSVNNYTFYECCELLNQGKASDEWMKRHNEEIKAQRIKQMSKKTNSFKVKWINKLKLLNKLQASQC